MPAYTSQSEAFDAASHKLAVGSILELLEIDATNLYDRDNNQGTIRRFVSSNKVGSVITFNGLVYAPWPLVSEGWEWTNGNPPRPTITLADGQGTLLNVARDFNGLVNAKVTRILTTTDLIDDGASSPPEVYQIARVTTADGTQITFELISALELQNKKFPKRLILRNAANPADSFPAAGRNRFRT